MRIVGIGTDIVEIERIQRVLAGKAADRFVERLLHPNEILKFQQKNQSAAWLAKRFATKEAVSKALGTGIGQAAKLTEIETQHNELGKPYLVLHGDTQATAERLGVRQTELSLSDERAYAVAFVILTGE